MGAIGQEVQYTLTLKDMLVPKLQEADKAAGKLETTMSAIQSVATTLGLAAGVAGIISFGQSVVDAGAKVEDARVGLTTLLRDADEAGRVIQNTMEDATKTPFAFEGLLSANKALIGAGESADGSRKAVLDLANAIAATGGGDNELQRMVVNMQQIRNTGEATAMDIKQFAFAGINIYKVLADATGKPIDEVKKMKVTYEALTEALGKAHDAGGLYANGLENMSQNTSVRLSNVGDAMFQLKVKIFDDLKPAIDALIVSGMRTIEMLRSGWDWLVKHKTEIKSLAIGVGAATAAYVTYNVWQKAVVTWEEIKYMWMMRSVIAESLLTTAQWALNVAMTANPIGIVVVAIGAMAAAFTYAYNKVGWFHAGVSGLWAVIQFVAPKIGDLFIGLGKIILGVLVPNPSMIKEGWGQLTTSMQGIGEGIAKTWTKGYADGMKEFDANQAVTDGKKTAKPSGVNGKGATAAGSDEVKVPKSSASKVVTIDISINKLIETFKVETTNLHESSNKIGQHVTNTILQAVNDASIIADM